MEVQRVQLEKGFRNGTPHCFRMRCRAILLKAEGLSSAKAREQTDMSLVSVNAWGKRFLSEGITGLETRPNRGRKPIMDCSYEKAVRESHRTGQTEREQSQDSLAGGHEERGE